MSKKKKIIRKENLQVGKKKVRCSLLTVVLIICIIELIASNIQNINKDIRFAGEMRALEEKRNEVLVKNKQLKSEIENFNSDQTIQSIARNNLKMAEQDEILIIINNKKDDKKISDKKE